MNTILMDIHLAFTKLERLHQDLSRCIHEVNGPAWFPDRPVPAGKFGNDHRRAIQTMTATHHRDDFVHADAGLLYIPPEAVDIVGDINAMKSALKELILSLRSRPGKALMRLDRIIDELETDSDSQVKKALKALGLTRINLTWLYRGIRLLPPGVQSISYSWNFHDNAIQKVKYEDFDKIITRASRLMGEEGVEFTRDTLSRLEPGTTLCICKPLSPNLKANVVYLKGAKKLRMTFRAPMPILFQDEQLPVIRFPAEKADSERQIRTDKKVSDVPLIAAINLYTYKEQPND